jgi:hypothetical protein
MPNPGEEKKQEEKPKTKSSFALLALLLVVIFAVAVYFFVWPAYERLAESQGDLASNQQSLDAQTQALRNTKKLLENYDAISAEDKKKIEGMLPGNLDEAGLFTLFETLAQKNKITVLALDISEKEAAPELKNLGIREVNIALNLASGPSATDMYGDFKRFLTDLELNLRLMDVISINYTPEASAYVLNIRTYRLLSAVTNRATISTAESATP